LRSKIIEPIADHEKISRARRPERGARPARSVGINDAASRLAPIRTSFPAGCDSAYDRQALITRRLLIADEPTTASM